MLRYYGKHAFYLLKFPSRDISISRRLYSDKGYVRSFNNSMIPGVLCVGSVAGLVYAFFETVTYWWNNPYVSVTEIDETGKKITTIINNIQDLPRDPLVKVKDNSIYGHLKNFFKVEAKELIEDKLENNVLTSEIKSNLVPSNVQYLIIGGGAASFSAARTIRINDPKSKILIVTNENEMPYMRPPLSKDLWYEPDQALVNVLKFETWNGKQKSVYFEHTSFYGNLEEWDKSETGGIYVLTNNKVTSLDSAKSCVKLATGGVINFQKCLIATGGRPKLLPNTLAVPERAKAHISYFRNIADFKKLSSELEILKHSNHKEKSITILGDGFLGTELAHSIAFKYANDISVNQIISSSGVLHKILPLYLSHWATRILEKGGVRVFRDSKITAIEEIDNDRIAIQFSNGNKLKTDNLLVAIGIKPNTEFLCLDGQEKEPAYLDVDKTLKFKDNIWAAGDVFRIKSALGNGDIPFHAEHYDNAITTGRVAGFNMTDQSKEFNVFAPTFWSDIGSDLALEGAGLLDSTLNTKAYYALEPDSLEFEDPANHQTQTTALVSKLTKNELDDYRKYQKGVVFYMKDDTIVGILTVNLFGQMDLAKKIVRMQTKNLDVDKLANIFDLYDAEQMTDTSKIEANQQS